MTVEELEGKRRKDIEEGLVKHDLKRQKLADSHDTPAAVARAADLQDPAMTRRRTKMMLPAPQVCTQAYVHAHACAAGAHTGIRAMHHSARALMHSCAGMRHWCACTRAETCRLVPVAHLQTCAP